MASCTCGRTCRIACDARSGQVRLVRSVTESWRPGSIQSEVPVKPRCPNQACEQWLPEEDSLREGVSQPRARDVPAGVSSRRVKSFTVARSEERRVGKECRS